MSSDFNKLLGVKIDGVFPLRGVLNSSMLFADEDKVSEVVSECFYRYNDSCSGIAAVSPTFEFGNTTNRMLTSEYFISIYRKEELIGKVYLKPYLYPGTNIMFFELTKTAKIAA